jgi:hypothetical protein
MRGERGVKCARGAVLTWVAASAAESAAADTNSRITSGIFRVEMNPDSEIRSGAVLVMADLPLLYLWSISSERMNL